MAAPARDREQLQSKELFLSEETRVRVGRLEREVFGDGIPGLGEEIRRIMRRNAFTDKLFLLVAAAIISGLIALWFKDTPRPAMSSEQFTAILTAMDKRMEAMNEHNAAMREDLRRQFLLLREVPQREGVPR